MHVYRGNLYIQVGVPGSGPALAPNSVEVSGYDLPQPMNIRLCLSSNLNDENGLMVHIFIIISHSHCSPFKPVVRFFLQMMVVAMEHMLDNPYPRHGAYGNNNTQYYSISFGHF